MDELKSIALELLEKYHEKANSVIWEYSGNINHDIRLLDKECMDYKKRIEGLSDG